MSYSNSSLNCFANCMAKYNHSYILHTPPYKPTSPHLIFGTMAHKVLYDAGILRDEHREGLIVTDYQTVIPSEVLYSELKTEFGINNWYEYFVPIIKQIAKYENSFAEDFIAKDKKVTIEREIKLQLTSEELKQYNCNSSQALVGIIDCLILSEDSAVILDYKFSTTRKTQEDFDMNSQLPLYALFVHTKYNIPLYNIQYGYIDIPKQSFGKPTLLSNGTLSRAKSQNVSQEMYEKAVIAVHGDDAYYNCKEGGYYYDCWRAMALNKAAYLSVQYLDIDTYKGILQDLFNTIDMIEEINKNNWPYLRKYDSYSCKNCEYLDSCKPWMRRSNEDC